MLILLLRIRLPAIATPGRTLFPYATLFRSEPAKVEYVKSALRNAIKEAIADGYTYFISGFAEGVDLYFADIVAELKEEYNLSLEAALPYRNRISCKEPEFKRLLTECSAIGVHSEAYRPDCYLIRNRFMANASDRVIAVYDGREKGGTVQTMRYAHVLDKEIVVINIE